jgi:Xaa-Pro aminopeptidase
VTRPDESALELGRLARLREQLAAAGCDAGVFYDPVNIRYATGTSNMQVYSLHNPCRYVFVPVDGPVVLFDYLGCDHLSAEHPAVGEVRSATSWYHFAAGDRGRELAMRWAAELSDLLMVVAGSGRRLVAVDRLDPYGANALEAHGVAVTDGQQVASLARAIKTGEEVVAIRAAVAACEDAIASMASALEPGISERALWARLHQANIEAGGEWIETRLLTSGPRTNPWYQECSGRLVENGDLVALDTDLIGVGGYGVDISRTWLAGDRPATGEQRRMFDAARGQVGANIELLRPGLSFRELAEKAQLPPEPLHSLVNACVLHGVGLCNEYPLVVNRDHFEASGYDGVLEAGMVLCVESLVAPQGGRESVKLEEQVLITDSGPEVLSSYPLDPQLAG